MIFVRLVIISLRQMYRSFIFESWCGCRASTSLAEGYFWILESGRSKSSKIINGNIGNESIDPLKFPNTNTCSAHTRSSVAEADVQRPCQLQSLRGDPYVRGPLWHPTTPDSAGAERGFSVLHRALAAEEAATASTDHSLAKFSSLRTMSSHHLSFPSITRE